MVNNNENITIRDIKENIFYVNEYQTYKENNSREVQGRKVRVGIFDNYTGKYFYRRLLACIIILKHSQEFPKYYSNIFGDIIEEVDFPDSLNSLRSIDKYMKFNGNRIDNIEISSKPVVYLLFFLISFYNLNNLLNDFYLIFNRTFTYEKQRFEEQGWDSLIKDDFLLNMLIFGLDELELSETSQEYFDSLQNRYIEKQKFYHQVIESNNLKFTSKFYNSIYADNFLIDDDDKIILEENKLFTYLKDMTPEERRQTEELILSLFVFQISAEYYQKIIDTTIQGEDISSGKKSLCKALESSRRAGLNDLIEYQKIQSLEKMYRYIDEDIATTFADKNISCKLKPFFL
ncbi:hypothetical protein H8787_05910 [Streptococcus sp. NSJ-72]|uniref:hypothetical protein n=1 Tax=Streptococcus sp. NSJ-72 TaxID=2763068 RepID=UPI0016510341|nr:hypothetical protein [Streptococcus sp. NSJ-72]QNL41616.1 hypothetical protein H8787_05910 [Streptococcus sp. NSJ-72]